ncbi:MAG: ABC transporter permease [Armatimonadetes bacterium]|nr:ABC transporter permease [Armatimonadota bacterium]
MLVAWVGPGLGLVFVYLLFFFHAQPSFHSWGNTETIFRQTSIVGTAAIGLTLVIIAGGIDLSVGSVVAVCTVATALLLRAGAPSIVAGLASIFLGLITGFINGLIITKLRVVPFIVTLGTLSVFRGLAKGLALEQTVSAPSTWINGILAALSPDKRWMLFPIGVWVMALVAALVAVLLRVTRLGRYFFAIGSNEQAARLSGVPVDRAKVCVYTLAGALAGLAGLMQFSRLTVGDPTVAVGLELDVIAAVVIGGGSLSGGQGSVPGSLFGALIMTVISNGCRQVTPPLPNWTQEIITGAIIVLAVAVDRLRQSRRMAH